MEVFHEVPAHRVSGLRRQYGYSVFMSDLPAQMYAGFWRRTAAFALDYVIILCYLAVLAAISVLLDSWLSVSQLLFTDRFWAQLTGFLLVTLPVTFYFSLSESSQRRGSWGKTKVGLQVTDQRGGRIHFGRALARTALKFVPWELSHTLVWTIIFSPEESPVWVNYGFILVYGLLGLNLASLAFTKRRQTLYDLLVKTYVIK